MKQAPTPLQKALEARIRLLETTLQPSSISQYRRTVRLLLGYLRENHPQVTKPSQLRRDPHLLGWLEYLWKLRTSAGKPLESSTRAEYVLRSRALLNLLADLPQPPRPRLLRSDDVPLRRYRLPRPLTPEDDARLRQYWAEATDALSCALLLQRLTGMRIGECVDLAPDCLRHLGDNRWSLHVPHGKPRSERWVPVDDQIRVLVERLSFLRTLPPATDSAFLVPRPKGRPSLLSSLRGKFRQDAAQIGIHSHVVPHQLRHTYATSMLRSGVSLPALMKLLGHHNANMTLLYVEVTQQDLQREYHAARLQPRHLMPVPPALRTDLPVTSPVDSPAVGAATAIQAALRFLELYRQHSAGANPKPLILLERWLSRIQTIFEKLTRIPDTEK